MLRFLKWVMANLTINMFPMTWNTTRVMVDKRKGKDSAPPLAIIAKRLQHEAIYAIEQ